MSQPRHRRLRKVQAFLGHPSDDTENSPPSTPIDFETPEKVRGILRVLLKDPWDDYSYIRHIGQTKLTVCKASSFKLADIREISPFNLGDPPILSQITHPNIAAIKEIYYYDEKFFVVAEYLEVPFPQLGFQKYDLEEREIATIVAEVIKGVAYLSSLGLSCKDLSQENIRLSLDGSVKLVLDPQNLRYDSLHESPRVSQVLLDFPILAEITEELMLSRYNHISDEEKWSKDALDFLSCTINGSFESLMNHCFLGKSISTRRLISRIRFAYEAERGSQDYDGEEGQGFNFNFAS